MVILARDGSPDPLASYLPLDLNEMLRTTGSWTMYKNPLEQRQGPTGLQAEIDSRIISGSFCQQERPWATTDPRPLRANVFVYVSLPTSTVRPARPSQSLLRR